MARARNPIGEYVIEIPHDARCRETAVCGLGDMIHRCIKPIEGHGLGHWFEIDMG